MDNPFNTFLPFNIKLKLLQLFKLKCLLRGIHLQKPSFLLRKQILFQLRRVSILNNTICFEILKHVYKTACLYKSFFNLSFLSSYIKNLPYFFLKAN